MRGNSLRRKWRRVRALWRVVFPVPPAVWYGLSGAWLIIGMATTMLVGPVLPVLGSISILALIAGLGAQLSPGGPSLLRLPRSPTGLMLLMVVLAPVFLVVGYLCAVFVPFLPKPDPALAWWWAALPVATLAAIALVRAGETAPALLGAAACVIHAVLCEQSPIPSERLVVLGGVVIASMLLASVPMHHVPRVAKDTCDHCGYSVKGLRHRRCPECGMKF